MTDANLPSDSDRALAAANLFKPEAEVIVNLQGDAPFTDRAHVMAIIDRLAADDIDIATPAIQLSWEALDSNQRDADC